MEATSTLTMSAAPDVSRENRLRTSWPLQRYVWTEVLKVFVFVFLLIELGYALLVAVVVSRRFDLDLLLVIPASWRTALSMLNESVPLALLFAAAFVYGRLVADREVTALKSFGLSYLGLLSPLILMGCCSGVLGVLVNGYLAPEMNYQKGNIGGLLAAQLRYLGEGYERNFPFGEHRLWILHYNGRHLDGIFLGGGAGGSSGFLPEDLARGIDPVSHPFYLWAERGEILFPEDVAREWEEKLARAETKSEEMDLGAPPSPGTFIFRLHAATLFLAHQILSPGEPTDYMHRYDFERLDFPYDPSAIRRGRQPKQLLLHDLFGAISAARTSPAPAPSTRGEAGGAAKAPRYTLAELETELHWRGAKTLSFLLYPVLAGLIALFLGAENRYTAFFVSSLLVPSIFYGVAAVGQVLETSGYPAWLRMYAGSAILVGLLASGLVLLEKRVFR